MSSESNTERRAWMGTIGSIRKDIIAFLLVALGSGSFLYFLYDNFVNVPDVTYRVLPSYELDTASQLGLVVVENRGRATAHEVLIRVYALSSAIDYYRVETQELWSLVDGGAGDAHLGLWLDRMTSGSSLTIFIGTSPLGVVDGVSVSTEEGRGHEAGAEPIAAPGPWMAAAAVLGGLIASIVWYPFYSRLKSEMQECQSNMEAWKKVAGMQEKLIDSDDNHGVHISPV